MKIKHLMLGASLLMASCAAQAEGFYLDLGVGQHSNYYDDWQAIDPIGIAEVGYRMPSGVTLFVHHESSLPDQTDNGFQTWGIKYHIEFNTIHKMFQH